MLKGSPLRLESISSASFPSCDTAVSITITRIVIATHNKGKLSEFRALLSSTQWEILGLSDLGIEKEHEETGTTFAENARLKALSYSLDTSLPVLADDSGLEVTALGGRPGIHSARYGGPGASDPDRIQKLLSELESSGGSREALFVCALALAHSGVLLMEAEGECRGVIAGEPRGNNGFGYDPVFFFAEMGKTYAELTQAEKNLCSHRSRAVHSMLAQIFPLQ
jgi:XTP/dITP diphosphohydrolase